MKIPLKVSINNFYNTLLILMRKFPYIRDLRPKEMEVLAEIMLQNYNNRSIKDFNKRQIVIFSTEGRELMRNNLRLKAVQFNNYIKVLKQKNVLTKDNRLVPFFDIVPAGNAYSLDFKFQIYE